MLAEKEKDRDRAKKEKRGSSGSLRRGLFGFGKGSLRSQSSFGSTASEESVSIYISRLEFV